MNFPLSYDATLLQNNAGIGVIPITANVVVNETYDILD